MSTCRNPPHRAGRNHHDLSCRPPKCHASVAREASARARLMGRSVMVFECWVEQFGHEIGDRTSVGGGVCFMDNWTSETWRRLVAVRSTATPNPRTMVPCIANPQQRLSVDLFMDRRVTGSMGCWTLRCRAQNP